MGKWLFGLLIVGLLLLGCTLSISDFGVLSKFDMSATALIQTATEVISRQLTTTQHASGFINTQDAPDPFQLTATALIRWATESISTREASTPDPFQLTATYFISEATRLSEGNGTPTPSSLDLTSTAQVQSMTREAPTLDAICPERTVHVWKIDVGHIPETSEIEIQVEKSRESPAYCPDYEQYEYYVSIWISQSATQSVFDDVFDRVIETLQDYPPQDENAIDSVAFYFWDERFRPVFIGTFTYIDAIAAYENGLRGKALLDALGIEVQE